MAKKEHVLAVTRASVVAAIGESGFYQFTNDKKSVDFVNGFQPEDVVVMSRGVLESNENYMQIIPYSVILNNKNEILVYKREVSGGESRLYDQYSIGIGGHISLTDVEINGDEEISISSTICNAMFREIYEEVGIHSDDFDLGIYWGSINDRTRDVDRVHLGAVTVLRIESDGSDVKAKEDQLGLLGFKPISEILPLGEFEVWSKILINKICEFESESEWFDSVATRDEDAGEA